MQSHEVFSTTADVGIRIRGCDCRELCRHALAGLNELLFGQSGADLVATESHRFEYRGDSCENVLVNLLGEIAFRVYEKRQMVCGLRIGEADRFHLKTELLTVPWPLTPRLEIKSVTYHKLKIVETAGVLTAEIVLDI